VPPAPGGSDRRSIVIMMVAVVVFSSSSSIVKWAETPGPVMAFWRMFVACVAWWIVIVVRRVVTGRRAPAAAVWRTMIPVGLFFGTNISAFFVAVNHTSIAHAEFITALSPLLLVPIGIVAFHERPNPRALPFGVLTLAGLAIVIASGPPASGASVRGDVLVALTMSCWVGYLVAGRRARATVDTIDFMATVMPIGLLVATPAALIQSAGEILPLTGRAWTAVILLSILTGIIGHGMIALAQRRLEVGTISVIQVAQPALAVVWAFFLLGEPIDAAQLPGMALVLAGLVGFTTMQQRRPSRPPAATATMTPTSGELTGTVG
jgi:drug/metabolite transporter (DMT)-like permease